MRLKVEEDIFTDLPDTRLMCYECVIRRDTDIGDRIRTRERVEDESITVDLRDGSCGRFFDIEKSSIDRYSSIFREALRDDFTRCIFPDVDDFCTSVCLLSRIREGDTEVECLRIISLKYRARIEHSDSRSEVASDPFDRSLLFDDGSFCIQIIGID